MSYNYLVPRICSLLPGYNCSGSINFEALAKRLRDGTGTLRHVTRVFHEGKIVEETGRILKFRDGSLINDVAERFTWWGERVDWGAIPGFLEEDIRVANGQQLFMTKYHQAGYVLNWAPNRKSYMVDVSRKFADTLVINQIAQFNCFVDTCSTIWIDRDRDCGESLVCVNPFSQPIVAKVRAEDGQTLRGNKIPPLSARRVGLQRLLESGERSWRGQVQITAKNRLQVYICKHSLADPSHVTDVEHLDPYRPDPTHMPAFRFLRIKFGDFLQKWGVDIRHTLP